jgi:hypothetical protein
MTWGRGGRTTSGLGGRGFSVRLWLLISQKIKINNVARVASKNAATFAVIGSDHKSIMDSVVLPPILSCGRAVRDAAQTLPWAPSAAAA